MSPKNLTTRISLPPPPTRDYADLDIFSSSLSTLFPDDVQNSHGIPGSHITYTSPQFGDLTLHIPAHPDVEEGRKLFAHYLWNSAVVIAEGLEVANEADSTSWNKAYWSVHDKSILELGAGTALPSLISALSGARKITITDHPSSPALTTDAIQKNVSQNLSPTRSSAEVQICGYVWGETMMYSPDRYGKVVEESRIETFDRILLADCLWMPSQHLNLVRTILHYLEEEKGCAIVVAGFHTGRATVNDFFEIATGQDLEENENENAKESEKEGSTAKLKIEEIFEIDIEGNRRKWACTREGETKDNTKRWCVCAVLVRG